MRSNPSERTELRQLIQSVHDEGVTIALVEHDVRMAGAPEAAADLAACLV
jgi:ABC-type branched-subunit amino acid transport system ATPase component